MRFTISALVVVVVALFTALSPTFAVAGQSLLKANFGTEYGMDGVVSVWDVNPIIFADGKLSCTGAHGLVYLSHQVVSPNVAPFIRYNFASSARKAKETGAISFEFQSVPPQNGYYTYLGKIAMDGQGGAMFVALMNANVLKLFAIDRAKVASFAKKFDVKVEPGDNGGTYLDGDWGRFRDFATNVAFHPEYLREVTTCTHVK